MDTRLGVTIDSKGARQGSKEVNNALGSMRAGASQTIGSFSKLKDALMSAQGIMLTIGAGLSFASAIQTTARFNETVSELSAITGAVGDDLDYLKAKALEFGSTTTFTASQSAEAFKLMASAKPDLLENAEALAVVTKEALALAEAAGITLPEAASTLGSALNQFSAGAEQASKFINVLAAGAKYGASEIPQTAEALKYAGTVAADANVSFEQLNAGIQVLSTVALKGTQAGTALRNIILRLQKAGEDELNPAVVGLTKALENLNERSYSTTQLMKLFGLENVAAAKALLGNVDALTQLEAKLTGTSTAYEQAAIRIDNLSGDWKALQSAIEGFVITTTDKATPALRETTQEATSVVSTLTMLIDAEDLTEVSSADLASTLSGDLSDAFIKLQVLAEQWQMTMGEVQDTLDPEQWEALAFALGVTNRELGYIIEATGNILSDAFMDFPTNLRTVFSVLIGEIDKFTIRGKSVFAELEADAKTIAENVAYSWNMAGAQIESLYGGVMDSLKEKAIEFLDAVASGLAALGADETAEQLRQLADALSYSANGQEEAEKRILNLRAEHRQALEDIESELRRVVAGYEQEVRIADTVIGKALQQREEIIARRKAREDELKVQREQRAEFEATSDAIFAEMDAFNGWAETLEQNLPNLSGGAAGGDDGVLTAAEKAAAREEEAYRNLLNNIRQDAATTTAYLIKDRRARAEALLEIEAERVRAEISVYEEGTEKRMELEEAFDAWYSAQMDKLEEINKSAVEKMAEDWADMSDEIEDVTVDALEGITDAFVRMAESGKLEFSGLIDSILQDIYRLVLEKNIIGPLSSGIEDVITTVLGSVLGGGGTSSFSIGTSWFDPGISFSTASSFTMPSLFANGGIMTPEGPMPLKYYATGGVSTSPEVSVHGEGSYNEANIPLPNGHSVPVNLNGALGNNVFINVINQAGAEVEITRSQGREGLSIEMMIRKIDQGISQLAKAGQSETAETFAGMFALNRGAGARTYGG